MTVAQQVINLLLIIVLNSFMAILTAGTGYGEKGRFPKWIRALLLIPPFGIAAGAIFGFYALGYVTIQGLKEYFK